MKIIHIRFRSYYTNTTWKYIVIVNMRLFTSIKLACSITIIDFSYIYGYKLQWCIVKTPRANRVSYIIYRKVHYYIDLKNQTWKKCDKSAGCHRLSCDSVAPKRPKCLYFAQRREWVRKMGIRSREPLSLIPRKCACCCIRVDTLHSSHEYIRKAMNIIY